jgi:hypothetical protein
MKASDYIPIIIVVAALSVNIALGISNKVGFSVLMIRCIVVTVVFGIFGYILTRIGENFLEYCRLKKSTQENIQEKDGAKAEIKNNVDKGKSNSTFDIKVPPLDDEIFAVGNNDSDNGFVEVNPANMGKYDQSKKD